MYRKTTSLSSQYTLVHHISPIITWLQLQKAYISISLSTSWYSPLLFLQFVAVLNSKKAKLRQLKDKIAALESADKEPKEDEDNESSDKAPKEEDDDNSSERTEPFEEGSDKDPSVKDEPSETGSGMHSSPEKSGATSTSRGRRGRKRTRR
jgi:DNA-repair protein XRCC4